MNAIRIESTVSAENIFNIIEEIPMEKDLKISYEVYENRFIYMFSLNKDQADKTTVVLDSLTQLVEELINKFYAKEIIRSSIDKKLGKLDDKARGVIIDDVNEVLMSDTLFIKEKNDIKNEIFKYLLEHNILIVDGYLNFRSKSYHKLIEKAVELVLGDFRLEIEYNEFIEMLKALVQSQTPEIELVNIVVEEGKHIILDSNFKKVENDNIDFVLESLYDEKVSDDDILLSTIIALCPSELIIHLGNREKDNLTVILEEIFDDRIKICRDCDFCNK